MSCHRWHAYKLRFLTFIYYMAYVFVTTHNPQLRTAFRVWQWTEINWTDRRNQSSQYSTLVRTLLQCMVELSEIIRWSFPYPPLLFPLFLFLLLPFLSFPSPPLFLPHIFSLSLSSFFSLHGEPTPNTARGSGERCKTKLPSGSRQSPIANCYYRFYDHFRCKFVTYFWREFEVFESN